MILFSYIPTYFILFVRRTTLFIYLFHFSLVCFTFIYCNENLFILFYPSDARLNTLALYFIPSIYSILNYFIKFYLFIPFTLITLFYLFILFNYYILIYCTLVILFFSVFHIYSIYSVIIYLFYLFILIYSTTSTRKNAVGSDLDMRRRSSAVPAP